MPRWLWITLFVLVAGLFLVGRGGRTEHLPSRATGAVTCAMPPHFADPAQPLQSDVNGRMPAFEIDGARFSPQAGLSLEARVLSREDYSLGRESRFSPTDLALGWGPMSAPGMADRLHVSQGGRWYRYRWGGDGPPLPLETIIRSSANMHMVPFDANVARQLEQVADGDVVRIHGWLVHIDEASGWHWRSSLSREDSGAGACELVLVCSISNQ
ncbi:MAG: hypothetical protein NT117_08085 [Gammaproteobacteria bacterium]|nr:hypothetical protein [Gammaproteobacteria bacterium]